MVSSDAVGFGALQSLEEPDPGSGSGSICGRENNNPAVSSDISAGKSGGGGNIRLFSNPKVSGKETSDVPALFSPQ